MKTEEETAFYLKSLIELKRAIMHQMIEIKDYDEVVKISQELDILINKYNRSKIKEADN